MAYYDECWVPRLRDGHNAQSQAMHFGAYDRVGADVEAHDDAKLDANLVVERAIAADAAAPVRVLDAGCGVAGTSLHLAARNRGWQLACVNVGAAQLARAHELAMLRGLRHRLRLLRASFAALPLAARSLDAAFFVESLCHSPARETVLAQVARVLRPGGTLVVVDFMRSRRALGGADEALYRRACDGFVVPDYFDQPIDRLLRATGFDEIVTDDRTAAAQPGIARSAAHARAALALEPAAGAARAHLETCAALERLVAAGILDYVAVRARRG